MTTWMPSRPFCNGFTLVELLVVLLILTLVASLVPAVMSGRIGGSELKSSARQVAAGLRLARSEAIAGNRAVGVLFDVERRGFEIEGLRDFRGLPGKVDLAVNTAQSELTDDGHAYIRFFPDGSATGGSVELTRDDRGYVVKVDWLTGRVRIVE
ncbi:MAG: GspH/FimT family protein [Chromatiales bacterium]|jgi:general secretion pathway protein H|nr:GspH/FimT family protein [Chromatiales bacterium]MDX9767972.1 GspH/FimT family protein [Ectothiorhodospiraceae bacterium]